MKKLFDIIPEKFFSIFTSKNRQLYVDALFILRDCFSADELIIRRDYYAQQLKEKLGRRLDETDFSEDEECDISEEENDYLIPDVAGIIIRKLEACGWVGIELIENQFVKQIFLYDYASDFLDFLDKLIKDENKVLEKNIKASYALLKIADTPADKVENLKDAYDNFISFERELIKIYTNIKTYHKRSISIDKVNDIMQEFLKIYQENINKKYISPLTAKNSVERYRTEIKNIFTSWFASPDLGNMIKAYASQKQISDKEAEDNLRRWIDVIEEKMDTTLPSLVNKIKEKDSTYKDRTISRIKYKSRTGRNIRKALLDVIKRSTKNDKMMYELQSSLAVVSMSVYDKFSLYNRKTGESVYNGEELRVSRFTSDTSSFDDIIYEYRRSIANDDIDEFVLSCLADKDEVSSCAFSIATYKDFALFILAVIRGEERDAPFVVIHNGGFCIVNSAKIPDLSFKRR